MSNINKINWDKFSVCEHDKKQCKMSGNAQLLFQKCQIKTDYNV